MSSVRARIKSVSFGFIAGVIILYVVLEGLGITCPIRYLTGISCCGCGMSRAWINALQLNFAEAFSYHPLFFLPPVCLIVWLVQDHIPRKVYTGFWAVCVVLFFLVYFVRMADPADTVVVFNISEGLIYRIFQALWVSFFPAGV